MLYTIGDLHLSLEADKPMDVFGGGWKDYVNKIRHGFSVIQPDDLCVICGDISWSMSLEKSLLDFKFIDSLPGRKIVLKGNHDYWWSTVTKTRRFFEENDIKTISILHNNFFSYGDIAICGTRGWFYEEDKGKEHDKKIMDREISRLETSLRLAQEAGYENKFCFLHYPPLYCDYLCKQEIELMEKYRVTRCFYGHIHGKGRFCATEGIVGSINYSLVSADHLGFAPLKIK